MVIIQRSEAIALGLPKYYTGKPCRHNHLSPRYTRSGTCQECIREFNGSPEDQRNHKSRRKRVSEMIIFRVRLFLDDLDYFREIVLATNRRHLPLISPVDCWRSEKGHNQHGPTALYNFACFAGDAQSLQELAQHLFNARCAKVEAPPVYQAPATDWPKDDPK